MEFIQRMKEQVEQELAKQMEASGLDIPEDLLNSSDREKPEKVQIYTCKVFQLPIQTLPVKDVQPLSYIVSDDLELVKTAEDRNMYSYLFGLQDKNDRNLFAHELLPTFQEVFTTTTEFLQETQYVIHHLDSTLTNTCEVSNEKIKQNWKSVKYDDKFCEHYGYLEWGMLQHFNHNSNFLQALSIAHILSPLMSFFIPFLFLIFPFIILKLQKVPITFSVYMDVLKNVAKNHFIGKALMGMEKFSITNLIYVIAMLGLYALQMYQNTMQCIRFYNNTKKINTELCEWKSYIESNIRKMDSMLMVCKTTSTYNNFCMQISHHRAQLNQIVQLLNNVCPFSFSLGKSVEIGYMLKCYYELHTNELFAESIEFCMGFDGYYDLMCGMQSNLGSGILGKAKFSSIESKNNIEDTKQDDIVVEILESDKEDDDDAEDEDEDDEDDEDDDEEGTHTYIEDQYYPSHVHSSECVKNNVKIAKNIILTGPNASGKTTLLKSTAINIIFSQQFGVGFYKSCNIVPYHKIHSYLNIPDTSGRDSLFQAESRRCKDILDNIQKHGESSRHFCIFDELYSGTNPTEASRSAYAFMKYISSFNHVDLILTTHYVSICDKLEKDVPTRIANYQMEVLECEHVEENTYKMIDGISTREGAVKILKDMEYPEQMLDTLKNIDLSEDSESVEVHVHQSMDIEDGIQNMEKDKDLEEEPEEEEVMQKIIENVD